MRFQPADLLLIVTGAHLSAEVHDRPIAYALRDRIAAELGEDRIVVCSDIWYLNRPELSASPLIAIGGPEVNALTADLTDSLPAALVVEGKLIVQMDVESVPVRACCWGIDAELTARALLLFAERHLAGFLAAA